jgi:hypothetical protein
METKKISQEKVRFLATLVSYKTMLLIQLCDNILSEEEGWKNVHQRFVEHEKSRRKAKIANIKHRISGFFRNRDVSQ